MNSSQKRYLKNFQKIFLLKDKFFKVGFIVQSFIVIIQTIVLLVALYYLGVSQNTIENIEKDEKRKLKSYPHSGSRSKQEFFEFFEFFEGFYDSKTTFNLENPFLREENPNIRWSNPQCKKAMEKIQNYEYMNWNEILNQDRLWFQTWGFPRFGYFSQFGEDFAIYHNFYKSKKDFIGTYVEFGAHHPTRYSNSAFFDYCLGWKGLLIECNPPLIKKFDEDNTRSSKLYTKCVSNQKRQMRIFKEKLVNKHLTSEGYVVEVDTLANILRENKIKKIDVMFVDVEGHEVVALRDFNFNEFKVDVVVIEYIQVSRELIDIMTDKGYYLMFNQCANYVFIRGVKPIITPAARGSRKGTGCRPLDLEFE